MGHILESIRGYFSSNFGKICESAAKFSLWISLNGGSAVLPCTLLSLYSLGASRDSTGREDEGMMGAGPE